MTPQQIALLETLLPRFHEIQTPPDVSLVLFHHAAELTPQEARAATRYGGGDLLKDGCGIHGFGSDNATRTCHIVTANRPARHRFLALADEAGRLLGQWATVAGIDPATAGAGGAMAWQFALFELAWAGRLPMGADCYDIGGQGFYSELRDAVRASCYAVEYLAGIDAGPELAAGPVGEPQRPKRRQRKTDAAPRPLTAKQAEAVQIVGECKGNYSEAARRLGVKDPKTVRQHYKAGLRKLGRKAVKYATQRLPSDKRGQDNVSSDGDRRRG